ncbi:MAG: DNA-damage-inducible protein [Calothrix sp. CSU_2_0]|nr:DNA-damage-inducible protein [Calothrix sp. CSU_2_0]
MDVISKTENSTSLFEQLKQVDEDGVEYWFARDLMLLLGYKQWRQFEDAIERAITACENIGNDCSQHFLRLPAKSTGGRPKGDFRFSRYGAYLTAMNGDSRKPEIAAAQSYFAIKTREAELAPQYQEILQTVLSQLDQQNQAIKKQGEELAQLQTQVHNLLPPSANFIPPGWDTDIWEKLPPQDKHHFRFLFRRRNFQPSERTENDANTLLVMTEQVKQRQKEELVKAVGKISSDEKEAFEAVKQEALARFENEQA